MPNDLWMKAKTFKQAKANLKVPPKPLKKESAMEQWFPGHLIKGRYEIRDIRQGGLAAVYLCFDHEFKQLVAVKTFRNQFLHNMDVIRRFQLEAESWMRLEKHRNIVWAKWVDRINGRPCIFMEYIPSDQVHGVDLSGWIGSEDLSVPLAVYFAIQICTGMIYAQRKFSLMGRPFVHRDLKPANIMVLSDGTAKVTDFGLAKVLGEAMYQDTGPGSDFQPGGLQAPFTRIGEIFGTPPYMAPEQWLSSRNLDMRADIYSFGCLLYEMLRGRPPFVCKELYDYRKMHLEEAPETLQSSTVDLPAGLDQITLKCLAKHSSGRYQSFEEVRNQLNRVYYDFSGQWLETRDEGEPLEIDDLSNIAMSLLELGKSEEALGYYDRLLAQITDNLNPEMVARVLNNRANCHLNMDNDEKALMNYELAKRIDPGYDYPWVNTAQILLKHGEFERALAEAEQAIRINPRYSLSHTRRADALYHLGRYEEAIEACTRAVDLDPGNVWAYKRRGDAYAAAGNDEMARTDYKMSQNLRIG